DTPDIPAVPEGEVTVQGRLHYSETEENTGLRNRENLPERQIMIVDVDGLAEDLPYPIYGGYAELTSQEPEPGNPPRPAVRQQENSGMSLSYAVQGWVLSIAAVVGWSVLVRREVHDARAQQEPDDSGTTEAAVTQVS